MSTRIAVVWLNGVVMGFDEGHYCPGVTDGWFGGLTPTQLLETCDDETQFQLWLSGFEQESESVILEQESESVIPLTQAQWKRITSVLRKS